MLVGKSTVPVGTAAELSQRAAALAPAGVDVEIAWNPEFLREGYAVHDTLEPDRIVLGVQDDSPRAEGVVRELYAPLLEAGVPFLVTDLQTAELVKVSANAFLATKISFINAISEVCEAAGADVTLLADALGYDPRIGRQCLNAGLGFGGGCLPKDIRAFMARAGELGANQALTFLREVDSINMRRRTRMVELATAACGGSLLGANIAVLGAAFKPESDDVRDSPALNVAGQLQLNGAAVNVYDPKALENARRLFPTLNYAVSVTEACEGADAVLVLTEWQEFTRPRPGRPGRSGAGPGRRRRPQLPRCRPLAAGRVAGVPAGRAAALDLASSLTAWTMRTNSSPRTAPFRSFSATPTTPRRCRPARAGISSNCSAMSAAATAGRPRSCATDSTSPRPPQRRGGQAATGPRRRDLLVARRRPAAGRRRRVVGRGDAGVDFPRAASGELVDPAAAARDGGAPGRRRHRAGSGFTLEPDVAADAITEWLERIAIQAGSAGEPLPLEDGNTMHLHATDPGLGEAGEWTISAAGDGITWSHEHGKGTVALRGGATELLLASRGAFRRRHRCRGVRRRRGVAHLVGPHTVISRHTVTCRP